MLCLFLFKSQPEDCSLGDLEHDISLCLSFLVSNMEERLPPKCVVKMKANST